MILLLKILASAIVLWISIRGGAELWRMGGHGDAWARAVAFPLLCCFGKLALVSLWAPWSAWNLLVFLYFPALWAMTAGFSYGVSAPPHKFWVWVFGQGESGTYSPVEIATRCTCGFFWSLAAAVFAFITGWWIVFGIYVIFLTIANGLQWLLFKDVEVSEKMVGACVANSILI